jgi:hypothetical protein
LPAFGEIVLYLLVVRNGEKNIIGCNPSFSLSTALPKIYQLFGSLIELQVSVPKSAPRDAPQLTNCISKSSSSQLYHKLPLPWTTGENPGGGSTPGTCCKCYSSGMRAVRDARGTHLRCWSAPGSLYKFAPSTCIWACPGFLSLALGDGVLAAE